MDAKTLFQEGVVAVRDEKDATKGRNLLMQSLRLEPENEMAWLWLSRTVNDSQKKIQCLERALAINPANQQARMLMDKLSGGSVQTNVPPPPKAASNGESAAIASAPVAVAAPVRSRLPKASVNNEARIKSLMEKAQACLDKSDFEGAIEQWVGVLEIQVDHEEALGNSVRHLSRLKYIDDARELVWNALNSGTQHPSIYLTAIDIARYQKQHDEADELRLKLGKLSEAGETVTTEMADYFTARDKMTQTVEILEAGIANHPTSQKLMLRLAEAYEVSGRKTDAMRLFEQAARSGSNTKEGKAADERLLSFAPTLNDKERGSVVLAAREAAGFGAVYLIMAWQDAGLDLLRLGLPRWGGVILGIVGGYLVITATSSPQQQPLAALLGGTVPPPPEAPKDVFEADAADPIIATEIPIIPVAARIVIGSIGAVLLVIAFLMVFSTAVNLLSHPSPAPMPTRDEVIGWLTAPE